MFQKGSSGYTEDNSELECLLNHSYPVNPCLSVLSVKSVVSFSLPLSAIPNSSASSLPPRFKGFALSDPRSSASIRGKVVYSSVLISVISGNQR
jgi:hypothetical protein